MSGSYSDWAKLSNFLKHKTPEKELLIDGLLYRRDLVALGGRRRHGKTTVTLNIAVSLAAGIDFLGYEIPKPRRVAACLMEDDTRELQEKARLIVNGKYDVADRLSIFTREFFTEYNIPINAQHKKFQTAIYTICNDCAPDLLILDNAAALVAGDVNNGLRIHQLASFCYDLALQCNCAVIVPAHPRKSNENTPSLLTNHEGFFEELMGSSHFINSFGSLWGIQRNADDLTHFLGGAQRHLGTQSVMALRKRDDGWFEPSDDWEEVFDMGCNTKKRQDAWKALPQKFKFNEGFDVVCEILKSKESYAYWIKHCVRIGLMMRTTPTAKDSPYLKRDKKGFEKKLTVVESKKSSRKLDTP